MNNIIRIHHIGYLVKNIENSINTFESLDYKLQGSVITDSLRKVDIAFLKLGDFNVELVCPHDNSDIKNLLNRYANSPYHICYEVSNLDESIRDLRNSGFVLFRESAPAKAISDSAKVVFLSHSNMGIIELISFE